MKRKVNMLPALTETSSTGQTGPCEGSGDENGEGMKCVWGGGGRRHSDSAVR